MRKLLLVSAIMATLAGCSLPAAKPAAKPTRRYQAKALALPLASLSLTNRVRVTNAVITLAWNASADPSVAGYNLYSAHCTNCPFSLFWSGATNMVTITNDTAIHFYYVTATNQYGLESPPSNQINYPKAPVVTVMGTNLLCAPTMAGPWAPTNSPWCAMMPTGTMFFKGTGQVTITQTLQ